jgi:hypothetical protein
MLPDTTFDHSRWVWSMAVFALPKVRKREQMSVTFEIFVFVS